jgi:hypothetical protein
MTGSGLKGSTLMLAAHIRVCLRQAVSEERCKGGVYAPDVIEAIGYRRSCFRVFWFRHHSLLQHVETANL